MTTPSTFSYFANDGLLAETIRLAGEERLATGRLIAALAEVDARRLYLGEGCWSLFVYCTHVLHLSEYAAYSRIEAARHKSKREVEVQVAALRPLPAIAPSVRKIADTAVGRAAGPEARGCGRHHRAGTAARRACCQSGSRQAARAGTVPSAIYDFAGDPREASPDPGPAPTLDSRRRCGADLR